MRNAAAGTSECNQQHAGLSSLQKISRLLWIEFRATGQTGIRYSVPQIAKPTHKSTPYAGRMTVELPYGNLLASNRERSSCHYGRATDYHGVATQSAYLHTLTLAADLAIQARAVMVQTLVR